MKTLYQITTEQQALIDQIEALDGEMTEELEGEWIIKQDEIQHKGLAYLEVIHQKENFNAMIDAEIKRLQALKKRHAGTVGWLKQNLLFAVKTFGAFEVGTKKFGTRASQTVEVEDVNALPKEFKVIKVTEQADKKALKEAIKGGAEIDGVELRDHVHLKIN